MGLIMDFSVPIFAWTGIIVIMKFAGSYVPNFYEGIILLGLTNTLYYLGLIHYNQTHKRVR